jgi:HAD superfamily hydrolase (TIGR01457 family)
MEKSKESILKNKRLFIFDLDGTLYLDGVLFDKALDLLDYINSVGGKYVFLTNNSSRSSKDYVKKLNKLGIKCDLTNVATSTQATIKYVKDNHSDELFYVVGTKSMISEMKEAGIAISDDYSDKVTGLILGYDTELEYQKLEIASRLLTEGALYLATHPDLVCPVEFGFVPDVGGFIKMLEYATKRTPVVIGKPNRMIIDMILSQNNFTADETILVGDRLYTDIACGQNAGIDTVLVLSGETKIEDLSEYQKKPTFIMENIAYLYNVINKTRN